MASDAENMEDEALPKQSPTQKTHAAADAAGKSSAKKRRKVNHGKMLPKQRDLCFSFNR